MMTEIESIESQLLELRKKRAKIEAAIFERDVVPVIEAAIGSTIVYRNNSYSCPESAKDYWNVFRRLLAVKSSAGMAHLIFEEFSIDSYGKASHRTEVILVLAGCSTWIPSGWQECSLLEFETARRETLKEIADPNRCVAFLIGANAA